MAEQVDDRSRHVVPRWWPLRVAASLGEVGVAVPSRVPGTPKPSPGELDDLRRDWQTYSGVCYASNLVDAALTVGRPEIAADAAQWLLDNGGVSDISLRLARRVLEPTGPIALTESGETSPAQRYSRIAACRAVLRQMPRNPLLLVEMAREYAALGQLDAARRAILVAVALAPNDRHVLRSASRFFLHAGDPETAHSILTRAPASAVDPWLMSAEIVAAQMADRPTRSVKPGLRLLESGRVGSHHTSELASAIGTLEHDAGNRKKVRRLFARALESPTENSVAQAGWIARHMAGFDAPTSKLDVSRAFEARAWESVQQDAFSDAFAHAQSWLADEPFASRPALFASWVASLALGDYGAGARVVESAAIANPEDPRLIAQLLYCRASLGDVEEAERLLPRLERLTRTTEVGRTRTEWQVVLEADHGLIAFRKGDVERGRAHYDAALSTAADNHLTEYAASALVNYAREEALTPNGRRVDPELLGEAVDSFPPASRGVVARFVSRIRSEPGPG